MQLLKAMIVLLLLSSVPVLAGTPWDADYFPNVPLTTHEGESVRFFDLIEGKVVAVNFIYTTCPDTCPLETARLSKVQQLLGDRVGKDIFLYSITIEPEVDTPEVLAKYAERYGAKPGWLFLTGKDEDITLLRKKFGLYIEEIQDGSNNHNLNLIIGNQATGQWMKRSPFENPYILATQIGSQLSGWESPPKEMLDYANAPKVRNISQGEQLYRTRCSTCHTIGKGIEGLPEGLEGPDLRGVAKRRDPAWLKRWIAEPDKMLAERDPLAVGLFAKYNELPMPNMRLSRTDVDDLLRFIGSETRRLEMKDAREKRTRSRARRQKLSLKPVKASTGTMSSEDTHTADLHAEDMHASHVHTADQRTGDRLAAEAYADDMPSGDAVAIMNAWIRQAHPDAPTHAGYMTLVNVGARDEALVALESPAYEEVEIHEMALADGMMKMRELDQMAVPAGARAIFEPGGAHLMLKGPKDTLAKGNSVDLTLIFASGRQQTISVRVDDR